MTVRIVRNATVAVTVSISQSLVHGYQVTEYKHIIAIYGHVSHRDDVTNVCMGSPFIRGNVKTEWMCAPRSHTEGMRIAVRGFERDRPV